MGSVFLNAPAPTCSDTAATEKYLVPDVPSLSSSWDENVPFIMHLLNILCSMQCLKLGKGQEL